MIFWEDDMQTGSPFASSSDFLNNLSQWVDAGGNIVAPNTPGARPPVMQVDTNVKHSGTGSIRLNYYAVCQDNIACGGAATRLYGTPTPNAYTRAWFRMSGSNSQGATIQTASGLFETSTQTSTKLFEDQASLSPVDGIDAARTWLNIGGGGSITNKGLQFHAEHVPYRFRTTMMQGNIALEDNRWYCIETYKGMNTVGVADGVATVWLDGVVVIHRTNLLWRNGTSDSGSLWTEFEIFRQGGKGNIWWDDVAVGDTRIGAGGAFVYDPTPPAPIIMPGIPPTTAPPVISAPDIIPGIAGFTLPGQITESNGRVAVEFAFHEAAAARTLTLSHIELKDT